jgi:hypothetical protein
MVWTRETSYKQHGQLTSCLLHVTPTWSFLPVVYFFIIIFFILLENFDTQSRKLIALTKRCKLMITYVG